MQGILVHGSNHFIVNGRMPSNEQARMLARKWELPVPGKQPQWPADLDQWSICTHAFRENLQWALVVASEEAHTAAVMELLDELRERGVCIVAA